MSQCNLIIFTGHIAMFPTIERGMHCGMMFLTIKSIRRGVILGHVGCGKIGMILVWSGASFQGDSEPGGPMIRAFLTGLKNAKYSQNPSSLKSDTFQFEWFNLYLDPCFIEIMNLATKLLDSA
jgi:hypothetical protein